MRNIYILIPILFIVLSCNPDHDEVMPDVLAQARFTYTDGIDRIRFTPTPADARYIYKWSSNSNLQFVQEDIRGSSYFKIPTNSAGSDTEVTLDIIDGANDKSITQIINIPAYNLTRSYGLGKSVITEKSNNVSYDWYVDQVIGTYPAVDCGPASVTMAIKWYMEGFTGTPADARALYHSSGGWWLTTDILDYLKLNNVPDAVIDFEKQSDVINPLKEGNIVILCLDMYYVTEQTDESFHVNKFYKTDNKGWGHFIVLKGYKEVDGVAGSETYIEVYDPYSFEEKYDDGVIKGKNRYYLAKDLVKATSVWWPHAIVISKNSNNARIIGLDPETVPVQRGR